MSAENRREARRVLSSLTWTACVVFAFAAAFAWWVYTQQDHLQDQNRNEIAHAGRDLTVLLRSIQDSVQKGLNAEQWNSAAEEHAFSEFIRRNPYVEWPEKLIGSITPNSDDKCRGSRPGFLDPSTIVDPRLLYSRKPLQMRIKQTSTFFDIPISGTAFDYLLIADVSGAVKLQVKLGTSGSQRGQVGWIERQSWEKDDLSQDYPVERVTDVAKLISPDGSDKAFQSLRVASGSIPVRFGGRDYYLYYHPITVPLAESATGCATNEGTWVVAGLSERRQMLREAILISPQWTVLLVLMLGAALSAQPWLKLALITPTERFRFADAALLVPSSAIVLTAVTLLLGSAVSHSRLATLASNGLEVMAQRVERQLVDGLEASREDLVRFDDAAWHAVQIVKDSPCTDLPSQTRLLSSGVAGEPRWAPKPSAEDAGFSQIAWVDRTGMQFAKATIYDTVLRVNVANRPYFREPLNDRTWAFRGNNVFVQSYRSSTTAGVFTAMSMRSRLSGHCPPEYEPIIAVISTEPLVDIGGSLPTGYGFAVITADGRVLFHSDKRRMLKGDFYEEISDDEELEALMVANTSGHVKTDYLRRRHELYVTPFRGIPGAKWHIVAYRDLQVLSTVSSETLLRAGIMCIIPISISLLATLAVLLRGKRVLYYLWPAESRSRLYDELAVIYALVVALALLVIVFAPYGAVLNVSLGLPLIPLAATVVWCRRRWRDLSRMTPPLSSAWPYARAVAILWILVSVVPPIGILLFSRHIELQKLEAFESARAKERRQDWMAADREKARNIAIANSGEYFAKRAQLFTEAFSTNPLADGKRRFDLLRAVDGIIPVYNQTAAWLRDQARGETGKAEWREIPGGYSEAETVLRRFSETGILSFVALGALVCLFVRYAVRTLFVQQLASSLKHYLPADMLRLNDRILFLVRSDAERVAILKVAWEAFRARAAAATQSGAVTSADTTERGAPVVQVGRATIVPDLERAVMKPETIDTLETAWRSGQPIVILSRADPRDMLPLATDTYVGERVPGRLGAPLAPPSVDAQRWRALLDNIAVTLPSETRSATGAGDTNRVPNSWFGALWDYCSRDERLTLVQVAEEGIANPHQLETVRRLVHKGLLTFQPNVAPMSVDFERFLKRSTATLEVQNWERSSEGLGWRGSRWMFLLLLTIAAVFIAGTQGAVLKTAATTIVTFGAALKAIQEIFNGVSRSGSTTEKAGQS